MLSLMLRQALHIIPCHRKQCPAVVLMQPGSYLYQYLVDGQWQISANAVVEPDAQQQLCNKVGSTLA